MTVKIATFTVEACKRVTAVTCVPTENGLTIIGGGNAAGKSTLLDSIAWCLGGDRFKPSNPKKDGEDADPYIRVELSNGWVVERKGKNSALKVSAPNGLKGNQTLVESVIEKLALDLPSFLNASGKEKANILLQIIGVGDQLIELDKQRKETYDKRRGVGVVATQKKKYADELPHHPEAPEEIVSISDLIQKQKEIVALNAGKADLRRQKTNLTAEVADRIEDIATLEAQLAAAKKLKAEAVEELAKIPDPGDNIPTDLIEEAIANAEETNQKVRDNANRKAALAEWRKLYQEYAGLSVEIENIDQSRVELLDGADMPLEGLSVDDGELIYNGQKWDCMSSAEQLRVAVAIIRRLRPECGFVLLDKLEQMDLETLNDFGKWLEGEGLQVLGARVSTGDECSLIIEDGIVKGDAK